MAAGYIYKDGKFDPVGAMDIPDVMNRLDDLESADTAQNTEIANVKQSYLPLAGGTMTGNHIRFTVAEGAIASDANTKAIRVSGGTGWNTGASLTVYGQDNTAHPGCFRLKAYNGSNTLELHGDPTTKSLSWGGYLDLTARDEHYTQMKQVATNAFFIEQFDSGGVVRSRIVLRSPNNSSTPGRVEIDANDGTNKTVLYLTPAGAMTWGGKNVVRTVNGVAADAAGNVAVGTTAWVFKNSTVLTSTAINTYNVSLSSYLPNDGKTYDVLVKVWANREDTSYTNSNIYVYAGSYSYLQVTADGEGQRQQNGCGIIPVTSNRTLKVEIAGYALTSMHVRCVGYRRSS